MTYLLDISLQPIRTIILSMEYNPREIEAKWQARWEADNIYKVEELNEKPKFYVLDMFPYPSGAGLHVGHPLGYIATDIVSRFKRMDGYNVLHPVGFDSFGLPAEQYAIETGQHPAITTQNNINTYIKQLKRLGLNYDWSRMVKTSDPAYYRWTQWIFMQLFNHYYDTEAEKAMPVQNLIDKFEKYGNKHVKANSNDTTPSFTAKEWKEMDERSQQIMLLNYRLTFIDSTFVNWCPILGTVLSNDEVKDGVSERGGHPVEKKLMQQWSMRITAYADRLLTGLSEIDWPQPIKDQQTNWIGKSVGAQIKFDIADHPDIDLEVFTTRIDTIYGVSFLAVAPEYAKIGKIVTQAQSEEVKAYVKWASSRSEVDRMTETKKVTGVFSGAYALHPFSGAKVPIYVADYVLSGYGTGAVMGVPSGDQRDWNFATHFNLPIIPISDAQADLDQQADPTKEGSYIQPGLTKGMKYEEAVSTLIRWLEINAKGKGKTQFRLRDAVFSRQRYWGEPVPVYFKDGVPYLIDESDLPLVLPEVDAYLPTAEGEPPLGRAKDWRYKNEFPYELSTMPGWAGSSWYWYRYMDSDNQNEFASKKAIEYWKDVDLYVGGSEHATGHLLYSRFWNHFLYDIGLVIEKEFAKKLINQGMIQGRSSFVYRLKNSDVQTFVSSGLKDQYDTTKLHVNVDCVSNDILDIEKFKKSRIDLTDDVKFILEDDIYKCSWEVEKMSKSKLNVVNPDVMIDQYGADCFRMFEMFLGPIEQSKPWDTNGITGVSNFLKKFWSLFYEPNSLIWRIEDKAATAEELRALHTCIKAVRDDIDRFSLNTCVSNFMKCVNELRRLNTTSSEILKDLVVLIAPFAPYTAEECWSQLGGKESVVIQKYPTADNKYLEVNELEYPVCINGKRRASIIVDKTLDNKTIESMAMELPELIKWLEGQTVKKVILVPGKMVNIVV